ncbi:MAG: hypothetical protein US24_C0037G0004 [candidate division WS6 bacterium GW2011_GWC2_36_7]|uniref:Uncharacterized protein n=1 Tax=candidate division WS6 bacterium GW2011_GWC2_36_7 TaxID=1619091 RepID=A0A0G0FCH9_9BACT|nr:MAG: hypothetical protein US24_C0037G0004 [candidate division WS6 bacterium GW2011_GWC2_36_7]HAM37503.1 hypothetical protein [Patescibacteria group bacterium]HAM96199.1 hypothetical protein [Patescibacteria group bacterium]
MPKKSTKKKLSALQKFALASLALLILMLGGTYLYVAEVEHGSVSTLFFEIRINKNIQDKPVKDLISYTLPSGWSEDTNALILKDNGNVLLKSADYAGPFSGDSNKRSGASIILGASPKFQFMTIKEYKFWHSLDKNSPDYKDIKIDGVNGIKEENPAYGYQDYLFIKGNYMIQFSPAILSEDVSTEVKNQYQKDIDSIINSIQFK